MNPLDPTLMTVAANAAFGLLFLIALFLMRRTFSKTKADADAALAAAREELSLSVHGLAAQKEAYRKTRATLEEYRLRLIRLASERAALKQELTRIPPLEEEVTALRSELKMLFGRNVVLEKQVSRQDTLIEEERKASGEKLTLLTEAKEQLTAEFRNLAAGILDENSRKFSEQNRAGLGQLLSPLAGQLTDFRKRIDDVYDSESRDRVFLHNEITHLKELNQRISVEAQELTSALKGDNRVAGSWGEVVLSRILTASGLREGHEYETQVNLSDRSGRRFKPDVIVRLPQGRDVIIDAKVSLKAYEQYHAASGQEERDRALKGHIGSIRSHIKGLSAKNYAELEGVRSLDFVLLFIPVESAFMAAMESAFELSAEAFEKNIMLVSPSTLLATLRTIENLWRSERQTRNSELIAKKAGDLYNKFAGFVDALEEVGRQIDRAGEAYTLAHNRLASGNGNLVRRVMELKKLGITPRKELPAHLIENNEDLPN